MKPNELDRMFDESLNRINTGMGALSGAYENSPLAADHMLLKKSWDYFRHRMNTLEEQWKKILESKDVEIQALQKEVDLLKEKDNALSTENEAFRAFDLEYGRSKANDYLEFEKKIRRLKESWEQERMVFMKKEEDFQSQIVTLEAETAQLKKEFLNRQNSWEQERAASQSQLNTILEQQKKLQAQWANDMSQKEAETLGLNAKIDLLRPEVERRDQRIQELKVDYHTLEIQNSDLMKKLADLTEQMRIQEERAALLTERYGILEKEKQALRESWSREQAEWRELWDRERELWERKSHEKNDFIDNK